MSDTAVETAEISAPETRRMLAVLCELNHHAELTHTPPGRNPESARVRLLQVAANTLLVDYPTIAGQPMRLSANESVDLRFVWRDQLFSCSTTTKDRIPVVEETAASANLLALQVPRGLEHIQRRNSYRLSLIDRPAPLATFQSVDDAQQRFNGALVEISETGGKALVSQTAGPAVEVDRLYRISFILSGGDEPLTLVARIERVQLYEDDGVMMVGASWQLGGDWPEARRTRACIAKFIASEQRKSIRQPR